MRRNLESSTGNVARQIQGFILIGFVFFIVIAIWIGTGFSKDVNLLDLSSNIIDLGTLYFTVVIVLKLSSQLERSNKESDVEKDLIINHFKTIYDKLEGICEKVDTAKINLHEIITDFNRIERSTEQIYRLMEACQSIQSRSLDCEQHKLNFANKFDAAYKKITYTAPRDETDPRFAYITVVQEDGVSIVHIHDAGKSAILKDLDSSKSEINHLILEINKA